MLQTKLIQSSHLKNIRHQHPGSKWNAQIILPVFTIHIFWCRKSSKCHNCVEPQKNKPMCYPQQLRRSWNVLYRNPPELCLLCVPEPSRTSSAICPATVRNLISFLHQNPPEPCLLSAPEPSEPCLLNHPEPHQPSAPEPSGTSSAFCTGTLQNLVCYLHRNLRNLVCWTLRNLTSFLHRNPPEPSGTCSGTWGCSCTGSHQSSFGLKTP